MLGTSKAGVPPGGHPALCPVCPTAEWYDLGVTDWICRIPGKGQDDLAEDLVAGVHGQSHEPTWVVPTLPCALG